MENTTIAYPTIEVQQPIAYIDSGQPTPFAEQVVILSKQEDIEQRCRINYLEAQQARSKAKIVELEQEIILLGARIKDLENRLFGKKSESSHNRKYSPCDNNPEKQLKRNQGQQPGSRGHGRTARPNLPIVYADPLEPKDELVLCPICGLPHVRNPALDEYTDIIEVEVKAHKRRYPRPAYTPSCNCNNNRKIITAKPPPKLIEHGTYGISFWAEIILSKYRYGQPTNRYLQNLNDLGLLVSSGTVASGLQTLTPLFEPILEALYIQQMTENLFHNDETRWFAGLQNDKAIIICDRYSAYKKLARLADNIVLAFCWVHVRRDFLDVGRSFTGLEEWALDWREQIGTIYHLNK